MGGPLFLVNPLDDPVLGPPDSGPEGEGPRGALQVLGLRKKHNYLKEVFLKVSTDITVAEETCKRKTNKLYEKGGGGWGHGAR